MGSSSSWDKQVLLNYVEIKIITIQCYTQMCHLFTNIYFLDIKIDTTNWVTVGSAPLEEISQNKNLVMWKHCEQNENPVVT